ncbi:MAG: 50S ribosomal protein L25/general stress protein Ctc [Gammaproteobacteria bacterium]
MEYIVEADIRARAGRGSSRALRRAGRVPGIIYGGGAASAFSCDGGALAAFMQDEAFHSSVVKVRLDGKVRRALLREVQRGPVRRDILHVDFLAVREDREISAQVPVHFINAESAPGVKLQHGVFTAIENQVAVHCLPQDLPEYIEVDVQKLEIGKSVHLGELTPPPGVRFDEITRGNDPALAAITSIAAEAEPAAETGAEDAASEESASAKSDR